MSTTPFLLAKALAMVLTLSGAFAVVPDSSDERWDPQPVEHRKQLTADRSGRFDFANTCVIDFNDPTIIFSLPDHAANTFVSWPYWGQACGWNDIGIRVAPIGYDHYHLNYVDPPEWCDEIGALGYRDDDGLCHPADPITEPRSGIQPHQEHFGIKVYAYNTVTKERVPFDLNQIRVMGGDAEVCFQRTAYPWISAGPIDGPAGYCGIVEPGAWDVSDTVTDAYEVRIWSRSPSMSFTDLGIGL